MKTWMVIDKQGNGHVVKAVSKKMAFLLVVDAVDGWRD